MKYQGFMPNDFINGEGVSVSLWTSGCPFRCEGCHNSQAWDKDNGYDIPENLINRLYKAISANGINRNFSILGGEPLADWNIEFVLNIVTAIRNKFPDINIYLWTGYEYEELQNNDNIKNILKQIDVIITGKFELANRCTTLPLIGSTNQKIIYLKDGERIAD